MTQRRSPGIHSALRWRTGKQLPRTIPDAALRAWLLDTGSLTRRVQQACAGRFRVRVEMQGWGRPRLDEYRALRLRLGRIALIREVHLLCDERPWVFARTVIPVTTLRGGQRRLAHLGSRPLGAVLFADPRMQRGPVQVARIPRDSALFAAAAQGLDRRPAEIWGRRSIFRLGGKPLLVSEFFLPAVGGTKPRP
ncbi:MAG TPA: chorismate lyase [Gammaproteobacteria bacterium]